MKMCQSYARRLLLNVMSKRKNFESDRCEAVAKNSELAVIIRGGQARESTVRSRWRARRYPNDLLGLRVCGQDEWPSLSKLSCHSNKVFNRLVQELIWCGENIE